MNADTRTFPVEVEDTPLRCPTGDRYAEQQMREGRIPVLSCEGACIRGEIAAAGGESNRKAGALRARLSLSDGRWGWCREPPTVRLRAGLTARPRTGRPGDRRG
jgi:hypothetical protein